MKIKNIFVVIFFFACALPAQAANKQDPQQSQSWKEKISSNKKLIAALTGTAIGGAVIGAIVMYVAISKKSAQHLTQPKEIYIDCCKELTGFIYLSNEERKNFENHKQSIMADALLETLKEYSLLQDFVTKKEGTFTQEKGKINKETLKIVPMIEYISSHMNLEQQHALLYHAFEQYYAKIKKKHTPYSYETFKSTLNFLMQYRRAMQKNGQLNLREEHQKHFLKNLAFTPATLIADAFLLENNNNTTPDEMAAFNQQTEHFIDNLYKAVA